MHCAYVRKFVLNSHFHPLWWELAGLHTHRLTPWAPLHSECGKSVGWRYRSRSHGQAVLLRKPTLGPPLPYSCSIIPLSYCRKSFCDSEQKLQNLSWNIRHLLPHVLEWCLVKAHTNSLLAWWSMSNHVNISMWHWWAIHSYPWNNKQSCLSEIKKSFVFLPSQLDEDKLIFNIESRIGKLKLEDVKSVSTWERERE